jgi:hypothetical protein
MLRLVVSNDVVAPSPRPNVRLAAVAYDAKGNEMKAILIDPAAHRVSAIEVEYETLSQAFTKGKQVKVSLSMKRINPNQMLFWQTGVGGSGPWYQIENSGRLYGRGLLIGYNHYEDGSGFCSIALSVREASELVRFGS